MSSSAEEAADPLSLMRKQLILAQVQLLELEDIRDELETRLNERTQALAQLQVIADAAFKESQNAGRAADARAEEALNNCRRQQEKLELLLRSAQEELNSANQRLLESQKLAAAAHDSRTSSAAREAALLRELASLKASWSWKLTKWLR